MFIQLKCPLEQNYNKYQLQALQKCNPQMINLKDEISMFQRVIYNKELAEFVTVDQQFAGEGLTMQSLITENNFMVEQLKRMEAALINYCKLNDKIYAKIIEHQLNIHDENARLNSIVSMIDRKLQEHSKKAEGLYNQANAQRKQLKILINSNLESLRQELQLKVDKVTFESKIKKILQDYDEGALQQQDGREQNIKHEGYVMSGQGKNGNQGANEVEVAGNVSLVPLVRKKGKVGYDQFYKALERIQLTQKQSQKFRQKSGSQMIETIQTLHRYIPVINKSSDEILTVSAEIHKCKQKIQTTEESLSGKCTSLSKQLENRTNDKAWAQQLAAFYNHSLKAQFQSMANALSSNQKDFSAFKMTNDSNIKELRINIHSFSASLQQIHLQLDIHDQEVANLEKCVQRHYEQFYTNKEEVSLLIRQEDSKTMRYVEEGHNKMRAQMSEMRVTLSSLTKVAEESIMKMISKRMEMQIKEIESNIRNNREKIDNLKYDIGITCGQIKNIRDILSKKANYSDFIINLEKKADREDLKQIQKEHLTDQNFITKEITKLHESEQQLYKSQKSSLNQIKISRPPSTRRTPSKPSKAVFLSYSINQRQDYEAQALVNEREHPVEMILQKRKIYSQNSKRGLKHWKSNVPQVVDFLI